ncbi:MAG: DNA replication/repair protein RecF [Candidatus Levyibacteriota bacterium]
MYLQTLVLQNFRSYKSQTFSFDDSFTAIIGPNTAGKTNLVEAISLLGMGKSFRIGQELQCIAFNKDVGRVGGIVAEGEEKTKLEITLISPTMQQGRFGKKFLVNGVVKTRTNFLGFLPVVIFHPEDLEIIIDGPSLRRNFLDSILEQVDRAYAQAMLVYTKALRQRNALLDAVKKTSKRQEKQFAYWDDLLIQNGSLITQKRAAFLDFVTTSNKPLFDLSVAYDKSIMSYERLLQYKDAEVASGLTLVGPHRDDFFVYLPEKEKKEIRLFGSRGQARLAVLQLKMLQITYMQQALGKTPLLVLDDIFSELDSRHIQLVFAMVKGGQVILTTTHKEFLPKTKHDSYHVIELGK